MRTSLVASLRRSYLPSHLIPTELPANPTPAVAFPDARIAVPEVQSGWAFTQVLLSYVWFYLWKQLLPANPWRDGIRLRVCLQKAGGLWVEIGKMLAMRTDIFGPAFCAEVGQNCAVPPPMPFEQVCQIIETSTGRGWGSWYSKLDPVPYRLSRLWQMHKAVLRADGVEVLVKVQRPWTAERFASDLKRMHGVGSVLRLLEFMPRLRYEEMYFELQSRVQQDTDFRYEAANLKKMRKSLRKALVFVPKVIPQCSTRQVLTMEFLPAVALSDLIALQEVDPALAAFWMAENNVNGETVARRLFGSFFRELCEEGLCHGNIRPDNVFLLRDGRFALIDMAMVHQPERRFLTIYTMMLRALSRKDYEKVADCILLLCETVPAMNLTDVRTDIVRCFRAYATRADLMGVPYVERSLGAVGSEAAGVLFRRNIVSSWEFMKVTNSWSTLDESMSVLYPQAKFFALIAEYFQKAAKREFKRLVDGGLKSLVSRGVETVSEILMFQTANLRKQAQVFQGYTSKSAYLFGLLFKLGSRVVLAAIVVGVLELLSQHGPLVRTLRGTATPLDNTWAVRLLQRAQPHSLHAFVIALLLAAYGYSVLRTLTKRFLADEIELPKS